MTTPPSLHHIADRVMNRPLLLHPDKAAIVLDVLQGRLPGAAAITERPDVPSGPEASRFFGSHGRDGGMGLTRAAGGTAVVSIVGSLVNRGAWIGANSGMVSYEGIRAQLDDAARDPEVRSIVLDIDSPGGEALGMAGLAQRVRQINAEKPVVAVVNDMAASAAYGIASGASRIAVSPTSITGSIGVVLMHMDRSDELKERGVAVTLIHAGAHKVDGHPFGPLPDGVKSELQAEVMKHYEIFTSLVAEGRGSRLSAEAARGTEARTFLGVEAIDAGLADVVASFDEIVAELAASTGPDRGRTSRSLRMTTETQSPAAGTENNRPEASGEALAAARAEGAQAERERIGAILTHEAAEGRGKLATKIALETDMTPEQAGAVMEVAAQEGAPAPSAGTAAPSIEQRASAEEEIGKGDGQQRQKSSALRDSVSKINDRGARRAR